MLGKGQIGYYQILLKGANEVSMLFNSLIFLFLFLPTVLIAYYFCEIKIPEGYLCSEKRLELQNIILVIFSFGFFAWASVDNVKVLLSLILINYIIGFSKHECKTVLVAGIVYNLYILIKYKYLTLILSTLKIGDSVSLLAPLGISFIIFHCISYLMDLYQDREEPEHSLLCFALYIVFFSKLIQGPIVKYRDMRDQLKHRSRVNSDNLLNGTERFIIGLGKKVLVADLLGVTVSEIFDLALGWGVDIPTAWIGCLAYTIQIYMDFSGYSDMALGLGMMFGFHFEENFNFPYRSKSITEFWRRWHISLGSWFREYLYIPLGGNRRGNVYINLFLVFLATGIWHGAGLLFLLWGAGHGLCVVFERRVRETAWYKKTPGILKWAVTMILVSIGWLTFRLSDIGQMRLYLAYMTGVGSKNDSYLPFTWQYFMHGRLLILMFFSIVGVLLLGNENIRKKYKIMVTRSMELQIIKYLFLIMVWILSFVTIVATEYSPFIYFQF